MKENIDFKFREDMDDDFEEFLTPIELLTGKYKGVIIRFGQFNINEEESYKKEDDVRASLTFNYYILNEEKEQYKDAALLANDKEFIEFVGRILEHLVLAEIELQRTETTVKVIG